MMNKRLPRWTPVAIMLFAGTTNTLAAGLFGAVLELSSLDGTNGFVLNGIDVADESGRSVSGAGDVNGDGVDDLIIGARYADPYGQSNAGESYVVFGREPCQADINNDGTIDTADLGILISAFGTPCP